MTNFWFALFITASSLATFSVPAEAGIVERLLSLFYPRPVVVEASPVVITSEPVVEATPIIVPRSPVATRQELDADFVRFMRGRVEVEAGFPLVVPIFARANISQQTTVTDLLFGSGYWWHDFNVYHNFFDAEVYDTLDTKIYLDLIEKVEAVFPEIQEQFHQVEEQIKHLLAIEDDAEFESKLRLLEFAEILTGEPCRSTFDKEK